MSRFRVALHSPRPSNRIDTVQALTTPLDYVTASCLASSVRSKAQADPDSPIGRVSVVHRTCAIERLAIHLGQLDRIFQVTETPDGGWDLSPLLPTTAEAAR